MEASDRSDKPRKPASGPAKLPRLLLADDHEDMLRETRELLVSEFDIVGTARDGAELLSIALELKPDVVVTDAKMPRLGGVESGRELLNRKAARAVVLLTAHSDPELLKSALNAGIRGYVLKVNAGEELIPAIYEALHGRIFVSSGVGSPSDFQR